MPNSRFILVYGPPASGKTTYVLQHKRESEPIVDLDMLFQAVTGLPEHDKPSVLLPFVRRLYALAIQAASEHCNGRVWIVTSAATQAKRACIMANIPDYQEIYMDVSPTECLRRIRADARRSASLAEWKPIIEKWFKNRINSQE